MLQSQPDTWAPAPGLIEPPRPRYTAPPVVRVGLVVWKGVRRARAFAGVANALINLELSGEMEAKESLLAQAGWCRYRRRPIPKYHGRSWQSGASSWGGRLRTTPKISLNCSNAASPLWLQASHVKAKRACRPLVDGFGQVVKWCGMKTGIEDRTECEETLHSRRWLSAPAHSRSIIESGPRRVSVAPNDGPRATFGFPIPRGSGYLPGVQGNP